MTDSEVLMFKDSLVKNVLLCCETMSGNRARIVQIRVQRLDVVTTFSDGVKAKPETLREIAGFNNVREAQCYLLGK